MPISNVGERANQSLKKIESSSRKSAHLFFFCSQIVFPSQEVSGAVKADTGDLAAGRQFEVRQTFALEQAVGMTVVETVLVSVGTAVVETVLVA